MTNFEEPGIRTWIEIDAKAIKNNYQEFRRILGKDCKLMAVTKSNAYGHGLIDYSTALYKLGVDWFGVDSIIEAQKLRDKGISSPILVLGHTLPEYYKEAAMRNISISVSNFESLKTIKDLQLDCRLNIHIKIDTGMHRQGFYREDVPEVIEYIKKSHDINFEGIYTHFASAKNPSFPADTKKQIEIFEDVLSSVEKASFSPIKHAAATAGAIIFPDSRLDMVRIGIGLMGLWPSEETKASFGDSIRLERALSWKTIVAETKEIKKGERIGYGLTELLRRDSKVAVLPIGYWHGFKWSLSSTGNVLIGGKRCRVLCRVSMDMTTVDVTDLDHIEIGDEVTLIGKDGSEEITVEEIALIADSYNYEVITQLNPLMKRVYIE
jgi:alanine racemase